MTDQSSYRPMGGPQRRPVYAQRPAALPMPEKAAHMHARQTVLMTGCATALVLVACAASPGAHAQSTGMAFQGTTTFTSGAPTISRGTTDVITVNSAETVINWRPNDTTGTGTIDFLPTGNTVIYQNNPNAGLSNYTVLNRILPVDSVGQPVSRIVQFNGTVSSLFNNGTGGSVWFYSPGGIIAGATSTFNVGGLVLTSNAIDTTGGLYGSNGAIRFRGAVGSTSAVQVQSGAQINALATGSYVALVAPRVVQGGTVTVNGSTAYVGAESADVTINGGLFDIAVTAGTTDGNGVVHTGTTAGPSSTSFTDVQRIYMVAMPKNNALTMLLSGTIGYTPAAAAFQDNSAVVLAAGYDVQGGEAVSRNVTGTGVAALQFGYGTWQNDLTASSAGDIVVRPGFSSSARFRGNAVLSSERSITLNATQQTSIVADRDVSLTARSGATGGTIDILASGGSGYSIANGQIVVTGALSLFANGDGEFGASVPPTTGAAAAGGTINVIATGGLISATSLSADATGYSGFGTQASGNARGGAITLATQNFAGPIGAEGGTLRFGSTTLDASAAVPFQVSVEPVNGGSAFGGSVAINGTIGVPGIGALGTLDLGVVQAKAQATGGVASTGAAGDATGGDVTVTITAGNHTFTSFNGDVSVAAGYASNAGTFGAAIPGARGILFDISGTGNLAITNSVSLYADANGFGGGASGGLLHAGQIDIMPHDGGVFTIGEDIYASARASARTNGGYFNLNSPVTPDALGGDIRIAALGGTFSASGIYVDVGSSSSNSAGPRSGNSQGGGITLTARGSSGNRGVLSLTRCDYYSCSLYAGGSGGYGDNGSNGTGGIISLSVGEGDFSANGRFDIHADGQAGGSSFNGAPNGANTGSGGNGIGGLIVIETLAGSGTLTFGDFTSSTNGNAQPQSEGTSYNSGYGGTGQGGRLNVTLSGGTLTANNFSVDASGVGGASDVNCIACIGGGTSPFQAGTGEGGTATFTLDGGSANIGALALTSVGSGGLARSAFNNEYVSANAGIGKGGTLLLDARSGNLDVGTLTIDASGTGGAGDSVFEYDGAAGGAGIGGSARLLMDVGSTAQISADTISVSAGGKGGAGAPVYADGGGPVTAGAGEGGTGGDAGFTLAGGRLDVGTLTISANGAGGAGGDNETDGAGGAGGDGQGGMARFAYLNEGTGSGHTIGSLKVEANGAGGAAGQPRYISDYDINDDPIYTYTNGTGGIGGSAGGGTATMLIDVDPVFTNLTVSADAIGAAGGMGGIGGNGGSAQAGTATLGITFGSTTVTNELRVSAQAVGGAGGMGLFDVGGIGGGATGGTATLNVSGLTAILDANDIGVLTDATGGNGGIGGLRSGAGLNGTAGGTAVGGTSLFSLSTGGVVTGGDTLLVSAYATGGTGGSATDGVNGGKGGIGGSATGGSAAITITSAQLVVNGNLSFTPNYQITASALGGSGGAGGSGSGVGATGGDGGNAGSGSGGRASFDADDGNFALGDLEIISEGSGGQGGAAGFGPGFPGNPSSTPPVQPSGPIFAFFGASGDNIGGSAFFTNRDSGTLAAGAVRSLNGLTMSGSALQQFCCANYTGGRVEFNDLTTAVGGGLVINGGIRLNSSGFASTPLAGIYTMISANPVTVGGSASFGTDGPMVLTFTNGGTLAAANGFDAYSGSTIDITHSGRPANGQSLSASQISIYAPGDITLGQGTSLKADSSLSLNSYQGHINAARLLGGSLIRVETGGNITLGEARTTGSVSNGGDIVLAAGSNFQGGYQPATLTLNGPVSATGSLSATSGGDILGAGTAITAGTSATFTASGAIELGTVDAGGDIGVDASAGSDAIRFDRLRAAGNVVSRSIGGIFGGNVTATNGFVSFNSFAGSGVRTITLGDVTAGSYVELLSGTTLTAGNIVAGTDAIATANIGSLTVGDVTAGDDIWLSSYADPAAVLRTGNVVSTGLGSDTAGTSNATFGALPSGAAAAGPVGAVIRVRSQGSVALGNVSSPGRTILVAERGGLSAGDLVGRQGLFLFGQGDISAGSATTDGSFYVANQSMFLPNLPDAYDGATLGALTPVKTDGSLSLSGPTHAGNITIATTGAQNYSQSMSGTTIMLLSSENIQLGAADATANIIIDISGGTGGIRFDSLRATGNVIGKTPGSISGGDVRADGYVELLSGAALTAGNIVAGTDAIATASGGSLTVGNVTAGDDIWLNSNGSDPAAFVRAGTVLSTGLGSDTASTSGATFGVSSTGVNGAGPAGSVILIRSQGSVAVGNVSSPGRTILVAERGGLSAGDLLGRQGLFLFGQGDISAGRATTNGSFYVANQSMFLPNLPAAYDGATLGALAPVKTDGRFSLSGPLLAGNTTIATTGAQSFSQSISGGTVRLLSSGLITGDGVTASGPLTIDALSGLTFTSLNSGGLAGLSAANGAITVTTDLTAVNGVTALARSINLKARNPVILSQLTATAGDIDVQSQSGVTIGSATASNALRITATGTARFNATAVGQSITVASGDIVIAQGARIGVQGTTATLLLSSNNNQRPTFIGGGDATGGYSLSATEMTQIAAANIGIAGDRVDAVQPVSLGSSRSPDVFVRAFTLTAGTNGNLGSGGTLTISTPGKLRVEGAVQITGLNSQGGLAISAGDALEVISGLGSIDLRDGNNGLGGILSLTSADVIVATLSAISDTAAAKTLEERERRLAANDGVVSEEGILRAGTIRADVRNGLYIQNSGASDSFAARRGFTAGTFAITTAGSNTQIAINGRLLSPTGAFVTGLQALQLVSINGTPGGLVGQYATGSKINGCLIATPGACLPSGGVADNRDALTAVLDPTVAVGRLFSLALVELHDFVEQGYPPLIDEPVTGAGNDDLWDRQCDANDTNCGQAGTQ